MSQKHSLLSNVQPLSIAGEYRAGVCNIGPEEIARRRMSGHLALAATVALFAVLVLVHAPAWTRLALVLTAGGAASGYLQAYFQFCAGFGSRGVYNFGPLGTVLAVASDADRAKDLRKATAIGIASLAIGLAVGIAAFALPI